MTYNAWKSQEQNIRDLLRDAHDWLTTKRRCINGVFEELEIKYKAAIIAGFKLGLKRLSEFMRKHQIDVEQLRSWHNNVGVRKELAQFGITKPVFV